MHNDPAVVSVEEAYDYVQSLLDVGSVPDDVLLKCMESLADVLGALQNNNPNTRKK